MHCANRILITLTAFSLLLVGSVAHKADDKRPKVPPCNAVTTTLDPQFFPNLDSKRIKVNYGPFTVPSRSEHHGMRNFRCAPSPPCKDCIITWMQAGLEYMDGSEATAETGMWLHHTVWQNMKRKDPMCKNRKGERFFASGNERTPIDLTSNSLNQFGYRLTSKDFIGFGFEAMNMEEGQRDVVLVVTWEYIPSLPKSFRHVQPYWFDVGGCGPSEVPAQSDSVFSFSSSPVRAPTSGVAAKVLGHLHDGGTHLEVIRNGQPFCVTRAEYENAHIKHITSCDNLAFSEGDEFSIIAHYNTSKHAPMAHPDNELEPVMGISLIYAVQDSQKMRHKKHFARTSGIAIFSIAFLAMILGLWWFRYRKGRAPQIPMPAWLRHYYTKKRMGSLDEYQPLQEAEDRLEYRD